MFRYQTLHSKGFEDVTPFRGIYFYPYPNSPTSPISKTAHYHSAASDETTQTSQMRDIKPGPSICGPPKLEKPTISCSSSSPPRKAADKSSVRYACKLCHGAKRRCERSDMSQHCERCKSKKLQCVPRGRKARPSDSETAKILGNFASLASEHQTSDKPADSEINPPNHSAQPNSESSNAPLTNPPPTTHHKAPHDAKFTPSNLYRPGACEACYKSRRKCTRVSEGSFSDPCARCVRLHVACVTRVVKRTGRRPPKHIGKPSAATEKKPQKPSGSPSCSSIVCHSSESGEIVLQKKRKRAHAQGQMKHQELGTPAQSWTSSQSWPSSSTKRRRITQRHDQLANKFGEVKTQSFTTLSVSIPLSASIPTKDILACVSCQQARRKCSAVETGKIPCERCIERQATCVGRRRLYPSKDKKVRILKTSKRNNQQNQAIIDTAGKACVLCRHLRRRCSRVNDGGTDPCSRCTRRGVPCEVQKPRKRKHYTVSLVNELRSPHKISRTSHIPRTPRTSRISHTPRTSDTPRTCHAPLIPFASSGNCVDPDSPTDSVIVSSCESSHGSRSPSPPRSPLYWGSLSSALGMPPPSPPCADAVNQSMFSPNNDASPTIKREKIVKSESPRHNHEKDEISGDEEPAFVQFRIEAPSQHPLCQPPSQHPHCQPPSQHPHCRPPSHQPPSHQPPNHQPHSLQTPSLKPPSLQPLILHPLSLQPPSLQPPSLKPPSLQPHSLQPPSHQPPSHQPPSHQPPNHQPPNQHHPSLQHPPNQHHHQRRDPKPTLAESMLKVSLYTLTNPRNTPSVSSNVAGIVQPKPCRFLRVTDHLELQTKKAYEEEAAGLWPVKRVAMLEKKVKRSKTKCKSGKQKSKSVSISRVYLDPNGLLDLGNSDTVTPKLIFPR